MKFKWTVLCGAVVIQVAPLRGSEFICVTTQG